MVFKRREKRSFWRVVLEILYPRGGWARAFEYVKHRVRRLPDTPEKISRGIWAGVFVTFTPLYGLHFLISAGIAKLMRGNIVAALMATFFGNPLTYVPIAAVSLNVGHFLLGTRPDRAVDAGLMAKFGGAGRDLWSNLIITFLGGDPDWTRLRIFYDEVFFPFLVGGIIPGIIAATIAYWLAVPLITAYQNRRRKKLREKLDKLKKNVPGAADEGN